MNYQHHNGAASIGYDYDESFNIAIRPTKRNTKLLSYETRNAARKRGRWFSPSDVTIVIIICGNVYYSRSV